MKQKTMPNGLGQGGQLEYFGYWIDRDIVCFKFYNILIVKNNHSINSLALSREIVTENFNLKSGVYKQI